MKSLRNSAFQYLKIQPPLSMRSVAGELGVPPRSLLDLIDRLDQHVVVHESGSLLPASVKGSATLLLASDGHWAFTGHVHENGFIKHNYVFAAGLKFVDSNGDAYFFTNKGSVTDSRDSDFVLSGRDKRISANWDAIKQSSAHFKLEVKVEIIDSDKVVPTLLTAIFVIGGGIAIVLFLSNPHEARFTNPEPGVYRWEKRLAPQRPE